MSILVRTCKKALKNDRNISQDSYKDLLKNRILTIFRDFRPSDTIILSKIEGIPKDFKVQTGIFIVYTSQNKQKTKKKS